MKDRFHDTSSLNINNLLYFVLNKLRFLHCSKVTAVGSCSCMMIVVAAGTTCSRCTIVVLWYDERPVLAVADEAVHVDRTTESFSATKEGSILESVKNRILYALDCASHFFVYLCMCRPYAYM